MPKAKWCGDGVYEAAGTFEERCLRNNGSLFEPQADLWTQDHLRAVEQQLGLLLGGQTFIEKFLAQLSELSKDEIRLAAELLYVQLLAEADTGGATKRTHLQAVLALVPGTVIPPALDQALDDVGVASFGPSKAYRFAHLQFMARLVIHLKGLSSGARDALLDDPYRLRDQVEAVRTSTDGLPAHALLHMLHPDEFDSMISDGNRDKLLAAFAMAPGVAQEPDRDRKIALIRRLASAGGDPDLDFYDEPFATVWKHDAPARWAEAVSWGQKLYGRDDFDAEERDYKLEVAAKVAAARDAVEAGDQDWIQRLRAAFAGRNNLTSWRANDTFRKWCQDHPDQAKFLLSRLWNEPDASTALRDYLAQLPADAIEGPGTRLANAAFLQTARDVTRLPFYKASLHSGLRNLLGLPGGAPADVTREGSARPEALAARLGLDAREVRAFLRQAFPRPAEEHGTDWYLTPDQVQSVIEEFGEDIDPTAGEATYASFQMLLEELRLRMLAAGTPLRDRLDAQGVAWRMVACPPPEDWSEADRADFLAFRGGPSPTPPPNPDPVRRNPGEVLLPAATAELEGAAHLPRQWLQRLIDLLQEKKGVILYGPPGTGKTFVAQALAGHVTSVGGSTRLVQFHPSYTYEDFFEGYRPKLGEAGALSFELVPGALREIAEEAEANPTLPYVLVIDEINRGNVAKVFGELYFLLEYRSKAIRLQYGSEEFSLPTNLFFVGTMNTADRSIALVDSALRRRFYFVGLMPTRSPVDGVLERWLTTHGRAPEAAALLAELNRAIADEEFSIGPSYFMGNPARDPDLERIWQHAVMPLLEEHFYGSNRDLEADFGLAALSARVAAAADAEPLDDPA